MNEGSADYPNWLLSDFEVGVTRAQDLTVGHQDVMDFAAASGDRHPLHVDAAFARGRGYSDAVAHGMLLASRSSALLARHFVGRSGLLISVSSDFRRPVVAGARLRWEGTVTGVIPESSLLELRWEIREVSGAVAVRGTALAQLPKAP